MLRRAFTLMELLVALAIISLTAAILMPAFFAARARSRQGACLSNLRQIALALKMYAQDNDEAFPSLTLARFGSDGTHKGDSVLWTELIRPYTKTTRLACSERALIGVFAQYPDNEALSGYALNHNLSVKKRDATSYTLDGEPDFSLRHPALTTTAFDARTGILALSTPDLDAYLTERGAGGILVEAFRTEGVQPEGAKRHRGGANYAFADGHATWLRPNELRVSRHSDGKTPGFGL